MVELAGSLRHARLAETRTFLGGGLERWRNAKIGIIGLGMLGSRFAIEAVRSGASIWACDPGFVDVENTGTAPLRPGLSKLDSVIQSCDELEPGRASGVVADVRSVGVGALCACDILVDASDDADLAPFLTDVSNGLQIQLIRGAVDGTG